MNDIIGALPLTLLEYAQIKAAGDLLSANGFILFLQMGIENNARGAANRFKKTEHWILSAADCSSAHPAYNRIC